MEDQIVKVFGTCGVINLAKIATEGMGLKADAGLFLQMDSKLGTRFGFVEFQTRQGAEAATKLDGILLGGRPIRVGPLERTDHPTNGVRSRCRDDAQPSSSLQGVCGRNGRGN